MKYKNEDVNFKILEEKRIVTILFADLKGFTFFSEKLSPEEVKEIMDKIFLEMTEIVERNGGYVDKYIGDSIMALFGAKESYGDDAERCIHSALEMQKKIDEFNKEIEEIIKDIKLSLRIGINTGEVVTGFVGKKREGDFTVFGDAVNIAKRIEEVCEPGKVWVSENTYNLTKRTFDFKEIPETPLKGKTEKIKIYEVERYKKLEEKEEIFFEEIFINREKEIEILMEKYNEAKEKSIFISLHGDIGVGKTKILKEFEKRIKDKCSIYRIYPDPLSLSFLKGFSDFLKKFYPIKEFMSENKNELEIEAGEYLDFALFPDKFNFKLGKEEEIKNTIFYAFSIFIEFLSNKKFSVFIIENGHLLDKTSFELLKYLSETVKNPLLFILSIRTPYYEENLQNLKKFFEIKLEPFEYEDTKEFVKKVLNLKEIDEEIFSKIYENTFGNPLNIVNILNFIKKDLSLIKISKGFLDFARATIDRLEEDEKKLLAILACLGERFDVELISALIEEKRIKLYQKLKKLLSIGILEEEENKETYRFKSNIYREIILNGLLKRTKENLHNFISEKIEKNHALKDKYPLLIAINYEKANKKEKSKLYYKIVVDKSLKNLLYEEAIEYLNKIIELSGDEKEIENAKIEMAKCLIKIGNILKSEEILINLWKEKKNISALINYIEILNYFKGEYGKSIEIIEKEVEVEKLPEEDKASIFLSLGESYYFLKDLEKSKEYHFKALNLSSYNPILRATILNNLGAIYSYGKEPEKAIYYYKEALKENEKYDNKEVIFTNLFNIANIYYRIGEYDKGLEYTKKALSIANVLKNKLFIGFSYQQIGYYFLIKGKYPQALGHYKKAIEIFNIFQKKPEIVTCYRFMISIYLKQCLWEEVEKASDEYLKIAEELSSPYEVSNGYFYKSMIHFYKGDFEKAKELNEKAFKIAKEKNFIDMEIICLINFGHIFLFLSPEKSYEYYKKSLELLTELNIPILKARVFLGLSKLYFILNEKDKSIEYLEKTKEIQNFLKIQTFEGEILILQSLLENKKEYLIKGIQIAEETKNYRLLLRCLYFLSLIDKTFEDRFKSLLNYFTKDLKDINIENFLKVLKFIE